jgi:hypothetical protein
MLTGERHPALFGQVSWHTRRVQHPALGQLDRHGQVLHLRPDAHVDDACVQMVPSFRGTSRRLYIRLTLSAQTIYLWYWTCCKLERHPARRRWRFALNIPRSQRHPCFSGEPELTGDDAPVGSCCMSGGGGVLARAVFDLVARTVARTAHCFCVGQVSLTNSETWRGSPVLIHQ